jgi:Domain of unknown function (DUF4333)
MTMLRCALIAAVLALALAGCGGGGSPGYDTSRLARMIRVRLDQHPGFQVQSVSCPKHAKLGKGVVVRCTATNRRGHVVRMRATQLDDKGTVHLVADEMFADNVERGIMTALAQRGIPSSAVCPERVPVVIGRRFDCEVVENSTRHASANVTIVDSDAGFTLRFS